MLLTIVQHTPSWVWMLLAALIWLGASQFFARSAGLRRVLLMPVAMTAFSGLGPGLGLWSPTAVARHPRRLAGRRLCRGCAFAVAAPHSPAGTRYDATLRRFELPGSGWPLLLILGIFLVKWAVGVELALQPMLAHDSHFALQIALVYGVFNGVFAARTGRLLRLAKTRTSAPEDFITA